MIDKYGNLIKPTRVKKKSIRKKNEKLEEVLTPNERANLQIQNEINKRIQRRSQILDTTRVIPVKRFSVGVHNQRVLTTEDFQNEDDQSDKSEAIKFTKNPYNISVMIPTFVTGKTNYSANHGCRKLNRLYCDNSQNFISQCGVSANTNCQMLDMIVDCRKVMAYNFYLKGVGMEHVKYSMFGPSSKCVRIKDQNKKKSAVCLGVQCEPSGTAYWIIFPNDIGIFIKIYQLYYTKPYYIIKIITIYYILYFILKCLVFTV